MTYIKKLVMKGFKSFPQKTEIPFSQGINVVLGPNGSGKSNISDALCFVLGRLGTKSLRASKAKNLIFMGTKSRGPSKQAHVEIILDNTNNAFSIDSEEVSIMRVIKKNGQSVYKINNQARTRQDILSLLAQAGIDPNGFNIVLQGQIQNFVRMHNEERRKIIEEVSGISIYESRKKKSLRELEKTQEKLKEISAILRERTAYLNNLEKERKQALRYKKLQKDEKNYKASIINSKLKEKNREKEQICKNEKKKRGEIERIKKQALSIRKNIENLEDKIRDINSEIQQSTGLEQEKLNSEIANIRAELEGIKVRVDNNKNKILNLQNREKSIQKNIQNIQEEIGEFEKNKKFSYSKSIQEKKLEKKNNELDDLEKERKKHYMIKSELSSIEERLQEKKSYLQNYKSESELLLKQIEKISETIFYKNTSRQRIKNLMVYLEEKKEELEELENKERKLEKVFHTNNHEIERQKNLVEKISKMDICPLCKNNITPEHISNIRYEIDPKIDQLEKEIDESKEELKNIELKRNNLRKDINEISEEISKRKEDLNKISNIEGKKDQIKSLNEKIDSSNKEIQELKKRGESLEKVFNKNTDIEERYENLKIEVQEISTRNKENLDSDISFKQKEIDRLRATLKQIQKEIDDLNGEYASLIKTKEQKEKELHKKRQKEEKLNQQFHKMISKRDSYQKQIRKNEKEESSRKNEISFIDKEVNEININKARINAEIENLESELSEYSGVEMINSSQEKLTQKLQKTQESLSNIGSVNLRSLEVYEGVKKEYDSINQKSEIIRSEKEEILKIIQEIDIKKKKTFLRTLKQLNELFSKNFSQLSSKGRVSLELENKKDPFEGGVGILVKTGHGKYFDATSLSGGEQVLVALSLIFAIQELNPYCFYIFDEIDAALDKKNSERLSKLLKKYMKQGQYIVITHNDEIMLNANNLYGVSMHDGISKILSMKF